MLAMSTQTHGRVPALTLGWRLKMALGEMSAQEMADLLDVGRGTVSRWMSDSTRPATIYVKQWALITGTDPDWLQTGEAPHPGGPDEGLEDVRARRESNSQPSDPNVRPLALAAAA